MAKNKKKDDAAKADGKAKGESDSAQEENVTVSKLFVSALRGDLEEAKTKLADSEVDRESLVLESSSIAQELLAAKERIETLENQFGPETRVVLTRDMMVGATPCQRGHEIARVSLVPGITLGYLARVLTDHNAEAKSVGSKQ